jgi:hypothetical protein
MTTKKSEYTPAFVALKQVLGKCEKRLAVKSDTATEYALVTKAPSPYPQHKGQPMWFGCARLGKAYASFHLLPLYMNPALTKTIAPVLKKRMQGKACFNFTVIDEACFAELGRLIGDGMKIYKSEKFQQTIKDMQ